MTIKPDAALAVAQSIAAQTMTSDGRTPLERVLTRNWPAISSWRNAGWTWRQIAALLTRGGVRLKNGGAVTDRYLAAASSRMNRISRSENESPSHPLIEKGDDANRSLLLKAGPDKRQDVNHLLTSQQPGAIAKSHLKQSDKLRSEIRNRMLAAAQARTDE
jgi:hypothetical protein